MRIRHTRTVVAALAASVALAGCGEQTSPRDRLATAAETTFEEGSASFSMTMDMELGQEGSGMSFTTSGEGSVDMESDRGRMEMSMPGAETALSLIFDGDVVYLRLPMNLQGSRPWIRQDASQMSSIGPSQTMGSRPDAWLDALEDVQGEIRSLGSDTVRGTDVQGYAFASRADDFWGGSDTAATDSLPASLHGMEFPTRVWLDGGDRVRRMIVELDMGRVMKAVQEMQGDSASRRGLGAMGAMAGTATMTVDFFDFGTEVEVSLPDSSEVTTLDEVRQRAAQDTAGETGG